MKVYKQVVGIFAIMFFQLSAFAQLDFGNIPDSQVYINKGKKIVVKNMKLTQFYKEYNCLWEVSYAKIDGLSDLAFQNFVNDWLIGMTAFGSCEGDKEVCYDFISHHYFFKQTYVSFLQNDLLVFYSKEGNCRTVKDSCSQMMDWVIYDLKTRKVMRDENLLIKEKENGLADLIIKKVTEMGYKLVPDWRSFDKQIGIETNPNDNSAKVVVYLYNDVVGNNIGLNVSFKEDEISPYLRPQWLNRIYPNHIKSLVKN